MVMELPLSDPEAADVYVLWVSSEKKKKKKTELYGKLEVPAVAAVAAEALAAVEEKGLGEEWRRYENRRSLNRIPSVNSIFAINQIFEKFEYLGVLGPCHSSSFSRHVLGSCRFFIFFVVSLNRNVNFSFPVYVITGPDSSLLAL